MPAFRLRPMQRYCRDYLLETPDPKVAKLKKKLSAVEYRLAEYMSTNDPVATSYAVQLRRIIAGAE